MAAKKTQPTNGRGGRSNPGNSNPAVKKNVGSMGNAVRVNFRVTADSPNVLTTKKGIYQEGRSGVGSSSSNKPYTQPSKRTTIRSTKKK